MSRLLKILVDIAGLIFSLYIGTAVYLSFRSQTQTHPILAGVVGTILTELALLLFVVSLVGFYHDLKEE